MLAPPALSSLCCSRLLLQVLKFGFEGSFRWIDQLETCVFTKEPDSLYTQFDGVPAIIAPRVQL